MALGPGPPFDNVSPNHERATAGVPTCDSASGPVRIRVTRDLSFMALPVVPHDGTTGVNEVPTQSLELVPVHFRGVGHPTAQLLDRIHEVRAISRQVIRSGGDGSILRCLQWVEGFIILSLFSAWFVLAGGDDPMGVGEIKLLDDEVCVALIGLDLLPILGAPHYPVEEPAF